MRRSDYSRKHGFRSDDVGGRLDQAVQGDGYAEEKLNTIDTTELFSQYPHIAKKITYSWGHPECRALLVSLISDSRGGVRAGFSSQNAKTLFALLSRHDALYPQFEKPADVWSVEPSGMEDTVNSHVMHREAGRHAEKRHADWRLVKYVVPLLALILFALIFKASRAFF